MNKFLEKIKEFFRRGKKEEVLALDEGKENVQQVQNEEIKEGVFPYKVKEPNFVARRIMAENEVMKIVAQEVEIESKIKTLETTAGIDEENLTSYAKAEAHEVDTEMSMVFMMAHAYDVIMPVLEEIYEVSECKDEMEKFLFDPEYQMDDRKKINVIEEIKKCREKKEGLLVEQSLKKQINGNFDGDLHKYIEYTKMNEEEFIDKVIESTLEVIKLEIQRETEILPTRYGIQYKQIDSFDEEKYDLPPELENLDSKEYKREEKEKLISAYNYIMRKGTITEGQEKVFKELLEKTVFEGTSVAANEEQAIEAIEKAMESGEVNAEFTTFSAKLLARIIMNTEKGVKIGPKEHNYKLPYVYKKEDKEGPYGGRISALGKRTKRYTKLVKYLEGQPKQKDQTVDKEIVE